MKWFRMYHSILDSVKVRTLSVEAQLDYLLLLCCAAERRAKTDENTGETGLDVQAASWRARSQSMATSVPLLVEAGLVELTETGHICLPDWEDKQQDSDTSTTRTRKYRERISKVGGYITPSLIIEIKTRDGHACVYCGAQKNLCIDHAVPVVLGGDNGPDNLMTACKACNSGKAGRTPEQAGLKFLNTNAESMYRKACDRLKSTRDGHGDGLDKKRGDKKRGEETTTSRAGRVSLQSYIDSLKTKGERFMPEGDPLWEFVESNKMPSEWLEMAFMAFRDRHRAGGKKYIDWRATFRNAVRENWLKLWRPIDGGGLELTATGTMAHRAYITSKKAAA